MGGDGSGIITMTSRRHTMDMTSYPGLTNIPLDAAGRCVYERSIHGRLSPR